MGAMSMPGMPMTDELGVDRRLTGKVTGERRLSLRGQRKVRRASVFYRSIASFFKSAKLSSDRVARRRQLAAVDQSGLMGPKSDKAMDIGGVPRYNLRQPGFEILPVFVFLSGSNDVDSGKAEHNLLRLPATLQFYEVVNH